jgi:hypothetical protein
MNDETWGTVYDPLETRPTLEVLNLTVVRYTTMLRRP